MPASDALQPPLAPAEREVVKSFGGWTQFCATYGLKPWDDDDNQEAYRIVQMMAAHDEEQAKNAKEDQK